MLVFVVGSVNSLDGWLRALVRVSFPEYGVETQAMVNLSLNGLPDEVDSGWLTVTFTDEAKAKIAKLTRKSLVEKVGIGLE